MWRLPFEPAGMNQILGKTTCGAKWDLNVPILFLTLGCTDHKVIRHVHFNVLDKEFRMQDALLPSLRPLQFEAC